MHILTTVPEVLDRAAHIIDQRGWIQHDSESAQGICLTHALLLAINASTLRLNIVYAPLCTTLRLPQGGVGLMVWNDAPERTKQEVLEALRVTSERVRQIQRFARQAPQIEDTMNGVWVVPV